MSDTSTRSGSSLGAQREASPEDKQALGRLAMQLRSSLVNCKTNIESKLRKSGLRSDLTPQRQGRIHRMDNVVLLCWIVKDLGWVLLCPLAMAAALVGLVLQGCHLLGQLHVVSRAEWAHSFAAFGWFFGSSVWMIDQFFYETTVHTDRTSPWYHGAFFPGHPEKYIAGVRIMQGINFIAIIALMTFYGLLAGESGWKDYIMAKLERLYKGNPRPTCDAIRERKEAYGAGSSRDKTPSPVPKESSSDSQGLVFGLMAPEVYSKVFILPLILRDLFWGGKCIYISIMCSLMVTALLTDNLIVLKEAKKCPLLVWSIGSAIWICGDLVMDGKEVWPMVITTIFFLLAAGAMLAVIFAQHQFEYERKEEYATLL